MGRVRLRTWVPPPTTPCGRGPPLSRKRGGANCSHACYSNISHLRPFEPQGPRRERQRIVHRCDDHAAVGQMRLHQSGQQRPVFGIQGRHRLIEQPQFPPAPSAGARTTAAASAPPTGGAFPDPSAASNATARRPLLRRPHRDSHSLERTVPRRPFAPATGAS